MRATNNAFRVWATVAGVGVAAIAVVGGAAHPAFGQGRLIGVDSSRNLSEIDATTGARTALGQLPALVSTAAGLAYDCDTGTMWLTSTGNDSLFTVNINTLQAALVGSYGNPAVVMHGLEWNPDDQTLYGASSHNGGLYSIDTATGTATLIGTSGLTSFTNIGYDSDGGRMYGSNSDTDSFYSVDLSNGAMTIIAATGLANTSAMAYDSDNHRMFLLDNTSDVLYTVNVTTGALTAVGSIGSANVLGLAYIPEVCTSGTPQCTADFNNADGVTADDIFAFLDAWFVQNGTCASDCSADFNGAGGVTADDIFAFLDAWFVQNGTCGL